MTLQEAKFACAAQQGTARDNWEVVNAADHDWLLSFLRTLSYECPVLSELYEAAYGSS